MVSYTQMGGPDRAEEAGVDNDGWKTFLYIIDGKGMDCQNAYNYLFKHKGMTSIEATKYQVKLLNERETNDRARNV